MVRPEGIRNLINLFGHFNQHTREITSVTVIPVLKRGLRLICPLQLIVALDGRIKERNQISQGNIVDIIGLRHTDR